MSEGEDKTGETSWRHTVQGLRQVLKAGVWSVLLCGMFIFTVTLCGRSCYLQCYV